MENLNIFGHHVQEHVNDLSQGKKEDHQWK